MGFAKSYPCYKKNRKGYYFHIKFEGIGKTIEELEKTGNIDINDIDMKA